MGDNLKKIAEEREGAAAVAKEKARIEAVTAKREAELESLKRLRRVAEDRLTDGVSESMGFTPELVSADIDYLNEKIAALEPDRLSVAVREAQAQVREAERTLQAAKTELKNAELEVEKARTHELLLHWRGVDVGSLDADDLRERVADYAREHGASCGRLGRAETTEAWRLFRAALAALARKAGARRAR